jgi:hypothetical protein
MRQEPKVGICNSYEKGYDNAFSDFDTGWAYYGNG